MKVEGDARCTALRAEAARLSDKLQALDEERARLVDRHALDSAEATLADLRAAMDEAASSAETRRRDMETAFDEERERVHSHLTQCIHHSILECQLPHKIVNLLCSKLIVNNKLTILWGS